MGWHAVLLFLSCFMRTVLELALDRMVYGFSKQHTGSRERKPMPKVMDAFSFDLLYP
jgi:hypothetical protein